MPNASTSRFRIGYAFETAFGGSIPAAPLKTLRYNEESILGPKSTAWSGEIEAGGNRVAVLELGKSAAGAFTSELSYTDLKAFLLAAIKAGNGAADTPSAGITRYTNGNTIKTLYFEKQATDIGAFIGVYGCAINEMTINIQANQPVTVQFGVIGKKAQKELATRGTGAIAAPATDPVIRAGYNVGHIKLGGSAIAAPVQSITLNIRNNQRGTSEVLDNTPTGINEGTFEVDGTMRVYCPSMALYDTVQAHTDTSLEIKLSNTAGGFYVQLPKLNLTDGTPANPGQSQDVMMDIPFSAVKGDDGWTMAIDDEPAE